MAHGRKRPRATPASGSNGWSCSNDSVRLRLTPSPSPMCLPWLQSQAGPALWWQKWPSGLWPIPLPPPTPLPTREPGGGGIPVSVVRVPRLILIGPAQVTSSALNQSQLGRVRPSLHPPPQPSPHLSCRGWGGPPGLVQTQVILQEDQDPGGQWRLDRLLSASRPPAV